jgi:murein DD-endopeptidase MepM/ murein hydrolase activator NlpD
VGFPLDPAQQTGMVTGSRGSRTIAWGEGATVREYSELDQPSADPERANRCGWNARVHIEYEGLPAVDWYVPTGTPVFATLTGTATLYAITISNAFDVYGVDREPYLGDPDRDRAPLSPFPGPGGGMGVLVRIEADGFRADYGHFDLEATAGLVPRDAFLPGYAPGPGLAATFEPLRGFRDWTPIARWPVRRGERIGFTGDSGYSEAPHLHYAIGVSGVQVCPTDEPGCAAPAGWLLR